MNQNYFLWTSLTYLNFVTTYNQGWKNSCKDLQICERWKQIKISSLRFFHRSTFLQNLSLTEAPKKCKFFKKIYRFTFTDFIYLCRWHLRRFHLSSQVTSSQISSFFTGDIFADFIYLYRFTCIKRLTDSICKCHLSVQINRFCENMT